MASFVLAYNPQPIPLVVSEEGRQIDGFGWGAVDPKDPVAANVQGLLVLHDRLPKDSASVSPAVSAAIAQVNDRNGASSAFAAPEPAHRSRKADQ